MEAVSSPTGKAAQTPTGPQIFEKRYPRGMVSRNWRSREMVRD